MIVSTFCTALKKVCRTDTWITSFVKVNLRTPHCLSFEELTRKIRRQENTGGTSFKERYFPAFDAMPYFWRKFSLDNSKLVVVYIHDMKKSGGMNDRVWTR